VSSRGYSNAAPLTAHALSLFSSTASTLLAFVTSLSTWNGLPVNIAGITDNLAIRGRLPADPTAYSTSAFLPVPAVCYADLPVTSASRTITVNLTNGASLGGACVRRIRF